MINVKRVTLLLVLLTLALTLFANAKQSQEIDVVVTPNPMKDYTEIICALPSSSSISLVITDEKGIVVKSLFTGQLEKGKHSFSWDGTDYRNMRLPEGTYIAELSGNSKFTSIKRFILLK